MLYLPWDFWHRKPAFSVDVNIHSERELETDVKKYFFEFRSSRKLKYKCLKGNLLNYMVFL